MFQCIASCGDIVLCFDTDIALRFLRRPMLRCALVLACALFTVSLPFSCILQADGSTCGVCCRTESWDHDSFSASKLLYGTALFRLLQAIANVGPGAAVTCLAYSSAWFAVGDVSGQVRWQ